MAQINHDDALKFQKEERSKRFMAMEPDAFGTIFNEKSQNKETIIKPQNQDTIDEFEQKLKDMTKNEITKIM